MDLGTAWRGPEIPNRRQQHLRDLLSVNGLDVSASKDIDKVVLELLVAVFQSFPREDIDRLLANVHRTVSTPSPTVALRVGGGFTPMHCITEENAASETW